MARNISKEIMNLVKSRILEYKTDLCKHGMSDEFYHNYKIKIDELELLLYDMEEICKYKYE